MGESKRITPGGTAGRLLAVAWLAAAAGVTWAGGADHREAFRRLPPSAEVLYMPAKYVACIACHPRRTFEEEDFNTDTGFRDTGLGKNLHWMHVFRQPKGTNCSACHRVEEGGGRLGYLPEAGLRKTKKGGACAPACHRPKEYVNAVRSGR